MKRPVIHITITDETGAVVHSETRSAFNAGVRASETAVGDLASSRGRLLFVTVTASDAVVERTRAEMEKKRKSGSKAKANRASGSGSYEVLGAIWASGHKRSYQSFGRFSTKTAADKKANDLRRAYYGSMKIVVRKKK